MAKRSNSDAKDGPQMKKRRAAHEKIPPQAETSPKAVSHVVELLPHSDLKDLVLDLINDPAISISVMNHLMDREHVAAQATYDSLLAEFEEFETEIRGVRYGGEIWGDDGMDVPYFYDDIALLCKAGQHGHELAWQAMLRIADNYKHNGEQGYRERDGPDSFDDDEFHWDLDSLMLECCIELEAQGPEHLRTTSRIRDLKNLRKKVNSELGYWYLLTLKYLKWVQGGKIGDYKSPDDYIPKPIPKPVSKTIPKLEPNSAPRSAGGRTKQTARKSAPSVMKDSKYYRAFAGAGQEKDRNDSSDDALSSEDEESDDGVETSSDDEGSGVGDRGSVKNNSPQMMHKSPSKFRTRQTARKRAPSMY